MEIKEYHTKTGKRIRLIHGDCMEWMSDKPENFWDLSICDPPYGLGERLTRRGVSSHLKSRTLSVMDSTWDNAVPQTEFFDILTKVSDNQIIWGGNYFNLPPTRCVIAWDKCQPWENFSQWEMAWTSFDNPARLFKFDNRTGCKIHPTQKPIKLYRWLLQNYAKEGDRILDTHGGSMSHAIACYDEDFELDIIELDKDYYDSAVKRFENHISQKTLNFQP